MWPHSVTRIGDKCWQYITYYKVLSPLLIFWKHWQIQHTKHISQQSWFVCNHAIRWQNNIFFSQNLHGKSLLPSRGKGFCSETGRFANESFRQRLCSVRKRVEVSSQTFRSQFANVINIDMSTYVLTVQFRILTLCLNYWVWNLTLQTFTRFRILDYLPVVCVNYWMWTLTAYFPLKYIS